MKNCRKCEVELVVGENWPKSMEKNCNPMCGKCHSARCLALRALESPERKAERAAIKLAYDRANAKKINAYKRERRKNNPGSEKLAKAEWKRNNAGKVNAATAKRRALIKQQTPSWYCHWMVVEIYEIAAEMGYEVDHIVPLSKGGLHSHENLQLLTREENQSKGAREHG